MIKLRGADVFSFLLTISFIWNITLNAQEKRDWTPKNSISIHYPVYNSFDGNSTIWLYDPTIAPLTGYAFELVYNRLLEKQGALNFRAGFGNITYSTRKHLQISERSFLYLVANRSFELVNGPRFNYSFNLGGTIRAGSEVLYITPPPTGRHDRFSKDNLSLGVNAGLSCQYHISERWYVEANGRYAYFFYRLGHDKQSIFSQFVPTKHLLSFDLGLGWRF